MNFPFNRFTKWAAEATGLKPTQLNSLKKADGLASIIVRAGASNSASGERSLRPLNFLSREGKEDEVPKVWAGESSWCDPDRRVIRVTSPSWRCGAGLRPSPSGS
jgi:hypothetical protein